MTTRFRDRLPFSVRWRIRRLTVELLRAVFQTVGDFLNIATKNGLNLEQELPPSFSELSRALSPPNVLQPFGAADFLLLSETETAATPETVETSIVIPVFNKADYTFQCLRSLFREIDLSKNEIIIVDNASTDATARMLELLKNKVRVVRNETNQGFVDACNQGAAAARGKFLVFLNNDTIVQPGWLNALTETIETDNTIGAVGSMLIYPNNRVQEAGGIVWSDANAHNYGNGWHPADARLNFLREVDYCSGASLLVRRDFFQKLGGFDRRFAPAYYEDTDLCMSVRAAGLKVVYQPLSKVFHYEGATAGKSTASGFKRFQDINRGKFLEKWRETLEKEHFPPDAKNVRAASDRKHGRLIAVFDNQVPKPDRDSGSVRMFAILKAMARENRVIMIGIYTQPENEFYERGLGIIGVETVHFNDFETRFKTEKFDVAVLSRPDVAEKVLPQIKKISPATKIIFDTVDVHFVRLAREFELTRKPEVAQEQERFKQLETRLAAQADQVWCVTDDDRKFLQTIAPAARFEIVPNIHAVNGNKIGKTFAERCDLLFVGGFLHRPNLDAVFYFLDEIFPLVLTRLPDVRLRVVGADMPPEIFARQSANVVIEGFVPNIEPVFAESRVFVAPLRYGAGMKGKIGQALAHGLPVVTTKIGAEGMNLESERELLIADDAQAFADAVVRLYTDETLWNSLANAGRRFIEDNYSPAVIDGKISAALETVVNGKRELSS